MKEQSPVCIKFIKSYRVRIEPNLQFITSKMLKKAQYQLFSDRVIKKLRCQTLQISSYDLTNIEEQWMSILVNLRKLNIKKLILHSNLNSKILKQIKHIKFPILTYLDLNANNIYSVQSLMNMDIAMLQYLDLSDNVITSLQPLGYSNLPNLKSLALQNNEFNDISFLFFLNTNKLETVRLQIDYYSRNLSVSIRDFFMLDSSCPLQSIWIQNGTSRIQEPQLISMLSQKFLFYNKN